MGMRCTLIARSKTAEDRTLRLGKAWDALEVLVTGGRNVRGGVGDAVTGRGGAPCEPQTAFGPSRRLSIARVASIANDLALLTEPALRGRVPLLAELGVHGDFGRRDAGVDPEIAAMLREEGFDDDDADDEARELLDLCERLASFYAEARDDGAEVIVSIQ